MWTETICHETALDRLILAQRAVLIDAERVLVCDSDVIVADIAAVMVTVFAVPATVSSVMERVRRIRARKVHLDELLVLPGIEQRTDAWYAARHLLVTASDIDAAIKNGPSREFLKKKCGPAPSAGTSGHGSSQSGGPAPLKHGVMFESVANAIYRRRQGGGCVVHEFGLLLHPTVSHLGASPDGINELGVMVEIKCPYSRKIDGTVPNAYFAQIQGQLEVCGLDECDYVECEIKNAIQGGQDEFYASLTLSANEGELPDSTEFGVVIERGGDAPFEYSPHPGPTMDPVEALRAWEEASTYGRIVVHRWRMERFNVVRVQRDTVYVAMMLAALETSWATVLRYRDDPAAYKSEVTDVSSGSSARVFGKAGQAGKMDTYGFVRDPEDTPMASALPPPPHHRHPLPQLPPQRPHSYAFVIDT